MLDLLLTVLSSGNSTAKITATGKESGASQVFICVKPFDDAQREVLIEEIINYTKSSTPENADKPVMYPGENTLNTRNESMQKGVWVDEHIWAQVKAI